MTQPPYPPHAPPPSPGPQWPHQYGVPQQPPQPQQPQSDVLGIIAFSLALLGFVFTCLPFTFLIDGLVMVSAIILGFTGLFVKDQRNFWPIVALCTAAVGAVLGFIIQIALTFGLFVLFE